MSTIDKEFHQRLTRALRNEKSVRSPDCPEPEVLLDWIEQKGQHPQAAGLLDHVISCACCRRAYVALRETVTLAARANATGRPLPGKVAGWVSELRREGITSPVRWARMALDRLPPPVAVRSEQMDLRPAFTAIRNQQPTLRWSAVETAQEYSVLVLRQITPNRRQTIWDQSAGSDLQVTLPEQAALEPGGLYRWQVSARTDGRDTVSPLVSFVVVTEHIRRRVETLEQEIGSSPLALISLYETYGLYEEALQQVETLVGSDPPDPVVLAIRSKLRQNYTFQHNLER